jgi:thioredoxin-related protein
MKKYLLFLFVLAFSYSVYAQENVSDSLPYQRYPTMPAFRILMLDSVMMINTYNIPKGKPTILMYFSPDCDHCEKMTETMLKHIDELKDTRIFLFSPMSLSLIRSFNEKLKLKDYNNIVIGQDFDHIFSKYYGAKYVPYIAIYDRDKKLVRTFEGGAKIEQLIKAVQW